MKLLAVAIILAAFIPSTAQLIQFGPDDPDYCTREERIRPNLHVSVSVHLTGRIIDETGAPFKAQRIELRRFISESKQIKFKLAVTDDDGRFDLGKVPKDEYRLIASPTRTFQQPATLQCDSKEGACHLAITLKANPTDMPLSQCPVR